MRLCVITLRWIIGGLMIAVGTWLIGCYLAPSLWGGLSGMFRPEWNLFHLIPLGFMLVFSGYALLFIVGGGFWLLPGGINVLGLAKRDEGLWQQSGPQWLVRIAFLWPVFLFIFLPSISFSRHHPPSAGTFLWFKIATTLISTIACGLLLWIPRGWWKVAMIPVVAFIIFLLTVAIHRLP